MFETYRLLGKEHELELERQARRLHVHRGPRGRSRRRSYLRVWSKLEGLVGRVNAPRPTSASTAADAPAPARLDQ